MTKGQICKPCSRSQKSSEAVKYCKDCEETLCRKCVKVHGTFKPLICHRVHDIQAEIKEEVFRSERSCKIHKDVDVEYYCTNHDSVCCKSCIENIHQTCKGIQPLGVAAENVYISRMFEEFTNTIDYWKKAVSYQLKETEKVKSQLNEDKIQIQKRIKKFKTKIIKMLARIESDLMTDVESTFEQYISNAESKMKNIMNQEKEINDISEKFQMVKSHADKKSLFLFLQEAREAFSHCTKNLERLMSSEGIRVKIEFEESDLLAEIKTLGSVIVKENLSRALDHQIMSNDQRTYVPTKFKLDKTVVITYQGDVQISDIGITRDDRIILCNWLNRKLLIYSDKLTHEEDIFLDGKPWSIAVVPNSDDAWVTLPERSCIQLVNITTAKTEPPLPVPFGCYGITLIGENLIALGRWREVHIINKEGRGVKNIALGKESMHALITGNDNNIYSCEGNGGMFHCINLDGSILFSKDQTEMSWPINVTNDIQGNLYVLGLQSNNVIRFSPDGKEQRVILEEQDGLQLPFAIAFNKTYSKLFVSNDSGKSISVFWCKYI